MANYNNSYEVKRYYEIKYIQSYYHFFFFFKCVNILNSL